MDDQSREKFRPVLYLAAGAYLIYLAVKLSGEMYLAEGMEHTIMLVGAVVFGIGGAGILLFGLYCVKKLTEKKKEEESH